MKKQLLTVVLILACLLGLSQHVYQFNGNLTGTGPTLTEVLYPGGTPAGSCGAAGIIGADTTETIVTSAGTASGLKHVFAFRENGGLSYSNPGSFITGTYTIHIFCRKTDFSLGNVKFQRVIDFSNGIKDEGLYSNNLTGPTQLANVYDATTSSFTNFGPTLANNQYYLITLVRGVGTATNVDFYVDGNYITSYNDLTGIYASSGTDPIIFFRDETGGTAQYHCESGPGAVRYISISNLTSTSGQVTTAWLNLVSSVLPVSLNGFSAEKSNTNALLQWKTATEVNTAYFNVERSYDGQTFTTINKVSAKGLSSSTYTYDDIAGLASSNTNTYYRLKIVDNNGNYKYSSVVRLANNKEISISVFPNPATDNITISGLKSNDIIKLLSVDGRVLSQQISGVQSMTMSIEKYKPGTYFIQVQNDKEVRQQKIIKY